jgi:beta-fructofuranosidase
VLDARDLPEGLSPYDFRDPKIWRRADGGYRCVVGARRMDKRGVLLLFDSEDGFHWQYKSILAENDGRFGLMWECPDFFALDGKDVLFVSPQDMLPEGFEYHNGNGTVCQIGTFDEKSGRFTPEYHQAIDYGIDFYAPQTLLTPDGRRVMIGWMQNWDTCKNTGYEDRQWFGQMTLPRELAVRDGRLYQQPIRELALYRSQMVEYRNVPVSDCITLPGVEGRCVELDLRIRPENAGTPYHKFTMRFAQDDQYHSILSYRPHESLLKIDRKFSGSRRAYIHQRRCQVTSNNGEIHLHVILDRFSIEAFVNDGEQVMTATILTDPSAQRISFEADGRAVMDITKYSLFSEE